MSSNKVHIVRQCVSNSFSLGQGDQMRVTDDHLRQLLLNCGVITHQSHMRKSTSCVLRACRLSWLLMRGQSMRKRNVSTTVSVEELDGCFIQIDVHNLHLRWHQGMQMIVPLPGAQNLPEGADFAETMDQKPVGKKSNFGTPTLVPDSRPRNGVHCCCHIFQTLSRVPRGDQKWSQKIVRIS